MQRLARNQNLPEPCTMSMCLFQYKIWALDPIEFTTSHLFPLLTSLIDCFASFLLQAFCRVLHRRANMEEHASANRTEDPTASKYPAGIYFPTTMDSPNFRFPRSVPN